jgi:hypothetical protein
MSPTAFLFLQAVIGNTTDHHNDGKTNGTDITAQLQPH